MDALQFYAIAFIIIWVSALLFKDKLKIEVSGPILMRKTTRLRDFIDSIAQKSPRFWKWSMNIGVPICVFFMILNLPLLLYSLGTVIQNMFAVHGSSTVSTVGIAIPGVSIPGSAFNVPLVYGLIGLVTVIVFHEFAHGILARTEGIKIKSIGLLMLAIIPGAFVEPDEEGVKKASRFAKLRIYAAGSMSNIAIAFIAFLLMTALSSFFIAPSFHPQGVEVQNTMPDTPAYGILQNGMIITHINGYEVTNLTTFTDILNTKIKPGEEVNITTNQGTFKIKTTTNSNNTNHAYLGVIVQNHLTVNQDVASKYGDIIPWFLYSLYWLFYWIFFLNIGIGTFNLLPAKPLDGGLMLEEILGYKMSSDLANRITNSVSIFGWLIVVVLIGATIVPVIS
ncbi:site-2 protease family protein [Methanobacterium sp.]|uniref:site-2 protease family protein n=1 Tax=Methanobacterium sp. TaxID=2164 RepID=UPI003C776F0A